MGELAQRAYFAGCLTVGRLLRSVRYASTRVVERGGEREVRKRRARYAPLALWLGGALLRILSTGVRVLPQREWAERERLLHATLRDTSIRVEGDGTLVLPCLTGATLASLLDDPEFSASRRRQAVACAVVALAELHALGFTHGDAMAENVMVDLELGVAQWFDFETVHESSRPMDWRRADDVRALLATCLTRTSPERRAETLRLILDVYADDAVTRVLAASFTSVLRRPLAFHLAQASSSIRSFREVARLLSERLADVGARR